MKEAGYVVKQPLGGHRSGTYPDLSVQLDIELTERCNNACIHCSINMPAGDQSCRARELNTDEWKDILHQAADLGVMTVRLTGGEPLLRDDFPELYRVARRLGLKVLLFTNARLITPALAALMAEIPPLAELEVSVYGMTRESYEAVTGISGSFAECRKGIQCLIDKKIPFMVKGALLPPNREEKGAFAAWAATLPWMDAPPLSSMFFELRGRRDSEACNCRINDLRPTPAEALAILAEEPAQYRREMAEFMQRCSAAPGDRLFTCGIGPGCVGAYGDYQPCLSLRHPDLCFPLRNGTLREAISSLNPFLREMRAVNPLYLKRCARCFLRGMCEQCPARSWTEHGTLDTPVEYLCEVAHAQARFLGLIGDGERTWEVLDSRERIQNLLRREEIPC